MSVDKNKLLHVKEGMAKVSERLPERIAAVCAALLLDELHSHDRFPGLWLAPERLLICKAHQLTGTGAAGLEQPVRP